MPKHKDPTLLTFGWQQVSGRGWHLTFWLFIVLLGLTCFFYLFQVIYPQSQRYTPVPQQIVFLNTADPTSRDILNKVRDRDFIVLPSDFHDKKVALEDHVPLYQSPLEKRQPHLEDFPHKVLAVPSARLLVMDEAVLPPLDLNELKPLEMPHGRSFVANELQLQLVFKGEFATRKLKSEPDLTLLQQLGNLDDYRFKVGVDDQGYVVFALPMVMSENPPMTQEMTALLRRLQFEPSASFVKQVNILPAAQKIQWGSATLKWGVKS